MAENGGGETNPPTSTEVAAQDVLADGTTDSNSPSPADNNNKAEAASTESTQAKGDGNKPQDDTPAPARAEEERVGDPKSREEPAPHDTTKKSEEGSQSPPQKSDQETPKKETGDVAAGDTSTKKSTTPGTSSRLTRPTAASSARASNTPSRVTSRREQQASLRNEARSKTQTGGQSPPSNQEGSAARRRPQQSPARTATPSKDSQNGAPTGSNSVTGLYYDQKKELQSYQSQVLALQEAIRVRDKEQKAQLHDRDEKLQLAKNEAASFKSKYEAEREANDSMRHTVNELHTRLKREEARRVEDISKDLEITDLRRTIAELRENLHHANNGVKPLPSKETPEATPTESALDRQARQRRTKELLEENNEKLSMQLELQQSRIRELEHQNREQIHAIAQLQDTLARYQGGEHAPELDRLPVASVVPRLATSRRGVTPPKRTTNLTPRQGPVRTDSPQHRPRAATPVGAAAAAHRNSPRRVPAGKEDGVDDADQNTEVSATGQQPVTKVPPPPPSVSQRNSTPANSVSRPTSVDRTQSSTAGNAAQPRITRASPSRVKQFVENSHFVQPTAAATARAQQTTGAKPRLPSPLVRTASTGYTRTPSTTRQNEAPTMVVRPTMVTAVKSDTPYNTGKYATTYRPTRMVRHHAWETPGSGTNGF